MIKVIICVNETKSLMSILLSPTTDSLDPDHDPLCVLLMVDYYAIRSGEYQSLIDLYHAWEVRTLP